MVKTAIAVLISILLLLQATATFSEASTKSDLTTSLREIAELNEAEVCPDLTRSPFAPCSKTVMVWMPLTMGNENISADLTAIEEHRRDITAVSYEQYELATEVWPIQGQVLASANMPNVTPFLESIGVQTYPMIISSSLSDIVQLLQNSSSFINQAVDVAINTKITGYNVDFEPNSPANATIAAEYANFLTSFADALHEHGKKLTVDVADWNPFWNYSLLSKTPVDAFYTMDTYAPSKSGFDQALLYALTYFPLSKLGVGLITYNVNNGQTLSSSTVFSRLFITLSHGISYASVWCMPLPSFWWDLLGAFKNQTLTNVSAIMYPNTTVQGSPITIIATEKYANGSPAPFQNVFFYSGKQLIGESETNENGTSYLSYSPSVPGSFAISARADNGAAFATAGNLTVISADLGPGIFPSLSLTVSQRASHGKTSMLINAMAVFPNGSKAAGFVVDFWINGLGVGSAVTNSSGIATVIYPLSSSGNYSITCQLNALPLILTANVKENLRGASMSTSGSLYYYVYMVLLGICAIMVLFFFYVYRKASRPSL